jgi:hypothetical protein
MGVMFKIKDSNMEIEKKRNLEIECFFREYSCSFYSYDLNKIVSAYFFPIPFYLTDGTCIVFDRSQFIENGEKLLDNYKTIGMKSVTYRIISVNELNASTMLIEIDWRLLDQQDSEIITFSTRYILLYKKNELGIIGVFEVNESEKMMKFKT